MKKGDDDVAKNVTNDINDEDIRYKNDNVSRRSKVTWADIERDNKQCSLGAH